MHKSKKLPLQISSNEQYRQQIGLGHGVLDIPHGFENLNKYNGSMGHLFNHMFFYQNCRSSFVRN